MNERHDARVRVRPVVASALPPDEAVTLDPARSNVAEDVTTVIGQIKHVNGRVTVEVVAGGWRFLLEVEPERRAALRDRATRAAAAAGIGGATEVRAMIPGRVVAVSAAAGDAVTTGAQLLVVEAMKMQNEVRSPADAVVARVAVTPGDTVELGDLLVVLEQPAGGARETP